MVSSSDIAAMKRRPIGRRTLSNAFPYLLVPVLVYNLIVIFAGDTNRNGTAGMASFLDAKAFNLPMLSDVAMRVSWGELFILFSVIFLFVEVIKSTNTASAGIINHILSMVLFIVCLMEFLILPSFATGTFFIITSIVLLDALAGMVVTIISARRDFGVEGIGA